MASSAVEYSSQVGPLGLWEHFRRLWARRETVRFLTSSQLKAGHRDKVLGHLWNLLDPLMFTMVYYFVFGVLFNLAGRGRSVEFMLYIIIGVITWRFIQGTISQSANCIRGNRGLIHEINFPKTVIPVSATLSRFYDLIWGTVVIIGFLLASGTSPTIHLLWLPLLAALTVLFTMGVAFLVSCVGAFFADTVNTVDVVMRLMFYCSPIFYYVRPVPNNPEAQVFLQDHATGHFLYMLNPVAGILESARDALLWGRAPEREMLLYLAAVSIAVWVTGFAIFTKNEGKFAKYI